MSRLNWRPGASGNETCVYCCGCHAQIAVAESRAAPTGDTWRPALHSCCTECEERYEGANPEAVTRAIAAVKAADKAYWDSPDRTWRR